MRHGLPWPAAVALLLLLLAACSDDKSDKGNGPGDVTLSDLVGTWNSTALTVEDPTSDQVVDLATLGIAMTIQVAEAGRYTLTIRSQGNVVDAETGVLSIDGEVLIANPDDSDQDVLFNFSLTGNVLELTDPAAEFDFDGDQVEEPAILKLRFARS